MVVGAEYTAHASRRDLRSLLSMRPSKSLDCKRSGAIISQPLRLDHVLGTLNDILRSCVELLDQLLHRGARQWRDRDFHLLGISEELRVLYRVVEGLAQNVDLLRRRARRCDIGALEYLLADHQLGHFAILILAVFPDRGNAHF